MSSDGLDGLYLDMMPNPPELSHQEAAKADWQSLAAEGRINQLCSLDFDSFELLPNMGQ